MIPLNSFLQRIFPVEYYGETVERAIENKIFKPRKDTEETLLEFPLDWESIDKFEDRNWRMQLQGWTMFHPIMNVFDSHPNKGKIIEFFFTMAQDWYDNYYSDPDDIVTSRMPDSYAWYDMSTGFRALIIAFFINRISVFELNITDKQNLILVELAKKHLRHLSCPETTTLNNNHGIFQLQGLMALSQCLGIEKHEEQRKYALSKMKEITVSQFDENGVHREHSPHYHIYALNAFKSVVAAGWYNDCSIIEDRISKAEQISKWLVDPLKRPACIGDSILSVQKKIDFNSDTSGKETKVNFLQSDFDNSGYSIIRSEWNSDPKKSTYLFFMAGYHSKVHKHRDCLSFEWFERGEKIICDGGKYGYKTDKFRTYALSNRAHNTMEIEGFDILRMGPYGSALRATKQLDDTTFFINACLEYNAINFDRKLYLNAGKWVIICDKLKHKKARKSTQWFHLAIGYSLKNFVDNRAVFTAKSKEIIINCLNKETDMCLYDGDEENMQGYISEQDYKIVPSPALGFSTGKKIDEIITIIALNEKYEIDALAFVNNNLSDK